MKSAITLIVLLASLALNASTDVIYGDDNRKDVYQTNNALYLKLAQATAGMISLGNFSHDKIKDAFDLKVTDTLEVGQNVCPTEAFSQQITAPICSAFLVGPDTMVTAGHCFILVGNPEEVCKSFAWVFDYNMQSEGHDPTKSIAKKDIYLCKKIIAAKMDRTFDYAVIKLNRPVLDREPLKFRTTGKIEDSAPLVVIGHPSGLPTKIADGGVVTKNHETHTFTTTLDTFHGNSGSAVFDSRTGVVEGILIQGKSDYQPSIAGNKNSCQVVNQCNDKGIGCSAGEERGPVKWGEVVLRMSAVLADINTALAQ